MEFTPKQIEVLKWIQRYDSILQLDDYHRPGDKVFNDDQLFDEWFDKFREKQEQKTIKHYSDMNQEKITVPDKASITVGKNA